MLCLVLFPAVTGLITYSVSQSLWGILATVGLTLGASVLSARKLLIPLQRVESRLRKTERDLQAALSEIETDSEPISSQSGLLAAEEQLYVTSSRVRTAVTSLREFSQRLEESKSLFEGVLETMQEAVLVIDHVELLLFMNSAARSLFDVPRSSGIGQLAWQSVRSSQLQQIVRKALEQGEAIREEVELPRQKRLVELSAVTLPLQNGTGCLVVAYDVTELRRLESMRRDFVSNVSHELKTPLTSIQAYSDTLLSGGLEDPDSAHMFVERISEQSQRLSALIQDLLRLAKIESQSQAVQIEPCDSGAITALACQDHRAIAESRGIRLMESLPSSPLRVLADPDGLRTILNNLIGNAIHYTPQGGSVSIRVRQDQQRVLFEVQDTGIGIAREHQARVFERFYRVDKSRSRSVGGTGLGLAIVKHLVEVMQGTISLESALGAGSTFRVWLPSSDTE